MEQQETGLAKFQSISEIVLKNKPLIKEKIQKAIDAGKLITEITTDEQDEYANNWLAKCNKTLPLAEGLRKEYTGLLDEWKKSEMADENALKMLMEQVRIKRNDRANKIAQANREKQKAIDDQKKKDLEIARIKSEQVIAVELGTATRISQGEGTLQDWVNSMTLETFDAIKAKLNFQPKLKEEIFRGFLAVEYDNTLVSYDEFKEICEKAFIHFNFPKCEKAYIDAVIKVRDRIIASLPARKAELQALAKASGEEKAKLEKEAHEKASKLTQERSEALATQQASIHKNAAETLSNDILDSGFKAQLQLQELTAQEGIRGVISYRLSSEQPMKIVEAISRAMINIFSDPAFKGIYKRDKAGIPKRNDKGESEYIDAIQDWLDLLAKVKPAPEFDGVIKTEDVATVAKAR